MRRCGTLPPPTASEEPAPAPPVSYYRSRGLSGVPSSQLRALQPRLRTQEAVGDGLQRAHSVPNLSYLTWKIGAGASSYPTGLPKVELAPAGEGPLWLWAFDKGWLPQAPLIAPRRNPVTLQASSPLYRWESGDSPKVSQHRASGVDCETLSTAPDLGTELGFVKPDAYIILRPP